LCGNPGIRKYVEESHVEELADGMNEKNFNEQASKVFPHTGLVRLP
jgi:hypothetical protein